MLRSLLHLAAFSSFRCWLHMFFPISSAHGCRFMSNAIILLIKRLQQEVIKLAVCPFSHQTTLLTSFDGKDANRIWPSRLNLIHSFIKNSAVICIVMIAIEGDFIKLINARVDPNRRILVALPPSTPSYIISRACQLLPPSWSLPPLPSSIYSKMILRIATLLSSRDSLPCSALQPLPQPGIKQQQWNTETPAWCKIPCILPSTEWCSRLLTGTKDGGVVSRQGVTHRVEEFYTCV